MRKFGCNVLAVSQQYDIIKGSAVRGAIFGESNELPITDHLSPFDALTLAQGWPLTSLHSREAPRTPAFAPSSETSRGYGGQAVLVVVLVLENGC